MVKKLFKKYLNLSIKQIIYKNELIRIYLLNITIFYIDLEENDASYDIFPQGYKLYAKLKKQVLSEHLFSKNLLNEKVFSIASSHFMKLLSRDPLYKKNPQSDPRKNNGLFPCFLKLDQTKDNMQRSMRLVPMKAPLENYSVLKGISFMRGFMLKRMMLGIIAPELGKKLPRFVIPKGTTELILVALMKKCVAKSPIKKRTQLNLRMDALMATPSRGDLNTPGTDMDTPNADFGEQPVAFRDSEFNSMIHEMPSSNKSSVNAVIFECEIIKIDHAVFCELTLSNSCLLLKSAIKENSKVDTRFGSSKEMTLKKNVDKQIYYSDINKIIMRRYNLIKQAVEIFTSNKKSIFLALYSEEKLMALFATIKQKLYDGKKCKFGNIQLIENPKKYFSAQKYQEDWKKKKISTFEYLMIINDCASRTFSDLSQYPVFPWVISDYTAENYSFSVFRDFRFPISGLTEQKQKAGKSKFENTEDFTTGSYQYGTHYMPGRAVLGYLLRLQPYTEMLYKFDSGGDSPSRHFHFLESLWKSGLQQPDANFELSKIALLLYSFIDLTFF